MNANQFVAAAASLDNGTFRKATTAIQVDPGVDPDWGSVVFCFEDGTLFDKATANPSHLVEGDNVVGYTESDGKRWLTLRGASDSVGRTTTVIYNNTPACRNFSNLIAFTIEFRLKFQRINTQASGSYIELFGSPANYISGNRLGFVIDNAGTLWMTSGSTMEGALALVPDLAENTEYEIAVQFGAGAGGDIRGYKNGVLWTTYAKTTAFENPILVGAYPPRGDGFYMTFCSVGAPGASAWIHFNRMRITKGVARYGTGGYTVPASYCPYKQAHLDRYLGDSTSVWLDTVRSPGTGLRELSHGYSLITTGEHATVTPEGGLRCIRAYNNTESFWAVNSPAITAEDDFTFEAVFRIRGEPSGTAWTTEVIGPADRNIAGKFVVAVTWSAANVLGVGIGAGSTVIRTIAHACISRQDAILCLVVWRKDGAWGIHLNGMSYSAAATFSDPVVFATAAPGLRFGWANPAFPQWLEINALRITTADRIGELFNQRLFVQANTQVVSFPNYGGIIYTGTPTPPLLPYAEYNIEINTITPNFNAYTAALNAGWNGQDDLTLTVTVNARVYDAYNTNDLTYAMRFTDFPVGPTYDIHLINNSVIAGHGGDGGRGGEYIPDGSTDTMYGRVGKNGGTALYTTMPIRVTNNGTIAGGGGGGGGGDNDYSDNIGGGGGGGHALYPAKAGTGAEYGGMDGQSASTPPTTRAHGGPGDAEGWTLYGGDGGLVGGAGNPGGAFGLSVGNRGGYAGKAVVGNSLITWIIQGTLIGQVT